MVSFQAKIGWIRQIKRENKNYRSVSFLPDAKQKIPKKQQKIEKIKKYRCGVFSSQNSQGKAEKERKQKLSFRSVPKRRVIENSKKNSNKIQQIKKNHYGLIPSQNWMEKAEKERK